ncbi:glutathione peroxidase [Rhodoferax saidenbachensis]|uniref:Glutathione peroxidase n=1 Tax=Rhodoferax saidenbachensis TaxID=1484693 RepID=A0A1P8K619_9BURK|nr:glutathione peroxidase [Rhodoferax saidenbachensis]APW41437.1 glutathione peroxidase [Rhodoferax saidenbachensis]
MFFRKTLVVLLFGALLAGGGAVVAQTVDKAPTPAASACPVVLQHQFLRLQDESTQNLCQYAGKVVLVVNTASYCGFTPQFEGLEALYAKYYARGLVVLGFPSNDFKQEAKSAQETADVCFNTYGVKFPMFTSSVVSGAGKNPLYVALEKGGAAMPRWNFHKILLDRRGRVVASFPSQVEPQSTQLTAAVEKALQAR